MARAKAAIIKFPHLKRDLVVIAISMVATVVLIQAGALTKFLDLTQGMEAIGSFVAGFFFTSFFTIALSAVALARLAEIFDPISIALWGSLGAVVGDLVLFLFIRDMVAEDLEFVFKKSFLMKFFKAHHVGFMRWLLPLTGGLIIASPLPDEIAISLMGLTKSRTKTMLIISFVFNFIGILLLIYLARGMHLS